MESTDGGDYPRDARGRNQVRWLCKKAKREFEHQAAKEAKINPKAFHFYARSKMKTKDDVADMDNGRETATTDKEKARILDYFSVVFL